MATIADLLISVGIDVKDAQSGAAEVNSRLDSIGKSAMGVGAAMTAGITAPIGGMMGAVVSTAAEFESTMNGVRAVTGATGDDFQALEGLAKEMGATTQFSATEAAQGIEMLGMAGFDTTQIMDSLPGVLDLAAAGALDLGAAADIASNVLTGFGMEAAEMGRVSDVLAAAASGANTDVQGLGNAFEQVGPVAAAAGFSFEETTAALMMLANAGLQGEKGGTALRGILASLLSPSSAAQAVLDDLGVSITDADGAMRPLVDIMRDFEAANIDAGQAIDIFGREAGPGFLAILDQGSDELEGFTDGLLTAEGAASEMADIRMEGLSGQLNMLRAAGESLMLAIADAGLLSALTKLAEWATEMVVKLEGLNPWILRIATGLALFAAAIGPVVLFAGAFLTSISKIAVFLAPVAKLVTGAGGAFALLSNPIGWVVVAIGALIAALVLLWNRSERFREIVTRAFELVRSIVTKAINRIREVLTALGDDTSAFSDIWRGIWDGVKSHFEILWEGLKTVMLSLMDAFDGVITMVEGAINGDWAMVWEGAKQVLDGVWEAMKAAVISQAQALWNAIKTFFIELPQNIGAWLAETAPIVKEKLAAWWVAFKEWFVETVPKIVEQLHTWGVAIGEWLINDLPGIIIEKVTLLWEEHLKPWFESLPDKIREALDNSANVVAWFQEWGPKIVQGLALAVAVVVLAIPTLMLLILAAILLVVGTIAVTVAREGAARLRVAVSEWVTAMAARVAERAASFVTAMRALPTKASAALRGMLGGFKSIGSNIVSSIISGVSGAASRLYTRMRNMASTALSSAKSALGIASPSKEFISVGEEVMNGFIKGLDNLTPQLEADVNSKVGVVPGVVHGTVQTTGRSDIRVRAEIDFNGADGAVKEMLRKIVKDNGGGDVQRALGTGGSRR